MKPESRLAIIACIPLALVSHSHAQSTWTGAAFDPWSDVGNWSAGVPDADGATVVIDGTTNGAVFIDDVFTVGTLTLNRDVNLDSRSSAPGPFDATKGLTLLNGGSQASITNSGTVFMYASLLGSDGYIKDGAGRFTFRFNPIYQTYTGDITISGGILGINQNSSLGDDENDILIAGGARLFAEPGSNSGTITLPDTRTITLGGFQSQIGSNNPAVNLVIEGEVTENAPGNGLVKTDGGVVTLAGILSYTGETRIAGGTLALAGENAVLPGDQNLRFNGATGTLNLGGSSQTVRTIVMDNTAGNKTITGGGELLVDGDANLSLGAANGVTHDFSGIDAFTYDSAGREFVVPTVNAGAVTTLTDVRLATAGDDGGVNSITANLLRVGGGTSEGNNGNTARLHLGTINTMYANTIQIGGFNAGGVVDFQSGLTAPSITLRAADGISPVPVLKVGETSSGTRRGEGVLNLTGGTLDATVITLQLGRHISGANLADTSSITMPDGSLEVQTMLMAEKTGGGTPTLTATFTQEGGDVTIDTLTMGAGNGSEAAPLLPTYRLWGGTLAATTIQSGGGIFATNSSRNLILRNGILTNQSGADLAISGITVTVAGNTTTVVDTTPGQKVVLADDVTYSARMNSFNGTSGTLTVDGGLDLSASPAFFIFDDAPTDATQLAPGTKLTLIDYTLGSLTGEFDGLPDGSTINVTKGAVTNTFVIKYADDGGTAVTLTVAGAGGGYAAWATANGIDGEPFDSDFDNDGISNGVEYALGLNPTISSQPPGVFAGNTITFTKGAEAIANGDVSWIIETSTTLQAGSWTDEVTQAAGDTTPTISYTFTPGSPAKKFARLKVVQVP